MMVVMRSMRARAASGEWPAKSTNPAMPHMVGVPSDRHREELAVQAAVVIEHVRKQKTLLEAATPRFGASRANGFVTHRLADHVGQRRDIVRRHDPAGFPVGHDL